MVADAYPTVSVVLPAYNAARFLRPALESILAQSYGRMEIIVIDDGSTDDTLEILHDYKDKRLRVLRNSRNRGLIATLNYGIAEARGKYIARMDADDVARVDRIDRQVRFLDCNLDFALVGSSASYIDAVGEKFGEYIAPVGCSRIKNLICRHNCFVHTSVMFRRDAVLDVGGYRDSAAHAEDYDLWLRLGLRFNIDNIEEPLVEYRIHDQQVSINRLRAQRDTANRVRFEFARSYLNAGFLDTDLGRVTIVDQLFGRPGSYGSDYLSWADVYGRMGNKGISAKLCVSAVLASPLCRQAWIAAGRRWIAAVSG